MTRLRIGGNTPGRGTLGRAANTAGATASCGAAVLARLADDQEGDDEQDDRHGDHRAREDRHAVTRRTHRPRRSLGAGTPVRERAELGSVGRRIMLGVGHAPTVSTLTWP